MRRILPEIINNIPLKVIALIFLTLFIGMTLGAMGYTKFFGKPTSQVQGKAVANYSLPTIIEEERETSANANIINILLLGHGGNGHSGGGLMDSIIAVSVNKTDKKVGLISIPRDLWFSGHKINSDPSVKDAVTDITGLPISNFISIDFNSFIEMIDSMGGITVNTKKEYTDNFYPVRGLENELCGMSPEDVVQAHAKYSGFELEKQFRFRYETISYSVGLHQMSGEEALKYVRSRHGDGDFGRSRRQFEVLKAILQKANAKDVDNVFDFVDTDLTIDKINKMLVDIGNPLEYSIFSLGLTDENVLTSSKSSAGAYILVPKEGQKIKEYIKNNL